MTMTVTMTVTVPVMLLLQDAANKLLIFIFINNLLLSFHTFLQINGLKVSKEKAST
jgi:hypothetical protein